MGVEQLGVSELYREDRFRDVELLRLLDASQPVLMDLMKVLSNPFQPPELKLLQKFK